PKLRPATKPDEDRNGANLGATLVLEDGDCARPPSRTRIATCGASLRTAARATCARPPSRTRIATHGVPSGLTRHSLRPATETEEDRNAASIGMRPVW